MRSSGPDTDTAAITVPSTSKIGALTDATPFTRSSTDSIQPAVLRREPVRTRPADPRVNGNNAPSGTIQRKPFGDSSETTQRRPSVSAINT